MKTKRIIHSHKSERGQSLVEVSLTFTVMLFLLAGAIDFGMALFSYVMIRDAAQEGVTYGSLNPADAVGIEARVRAASPRASGQLAFYPVNLADNSLVNVDVDWSDDTMKCEGISGGVSTAVSVTVEFDYPISMPLTGQIIGSDIIPLRAVVTDTILTPTCP
jgi:Flp pilus assembly protein TadG